MLFIIHPSGSARQGQHCLVLVNISACRCKGFPAGIASKGKNAFQPSAVSLAGHNAEVGK